MKHIDGKEVTAETKGKDTGWSRCECGRLHERGTDCVPCRNQQVRDWEDSRDEAHDAKAKGGS